MTKLFCLTQIVAVYNEVKSGKIKPKYTKITCQYCYVSLIGTDTFVLRGSPHKEVYDILLTKEQWEIYVEMLLTHPEIKKEWAVPHDHPIMFFLRECVEDFNQWQLIINEGSYEIT